MSGFRGDLPLPFFSSLDEPDEVAPTEKPVSMREQELLT